MEQDMLRQVLDLGMAGVALVVMALVIRHLYMRCLNYEKEVLAARTELATMALKNQEQIREYIDTFKIVLQHLRNGGG